MHQPSIRPKFEFADGLRAVAALTVAVLHATTFTGHLGDADENVPVISRMMELGNYAVPAFIVLSGYVLMLPVARTENFTLRGGFWSYIVRRARRILPPYYASLALFMILIALIPALQTHQDTGWDNKVPVTLEGVISHVLLVHNWNNEWIYQINGPAWSVATEWHIYFLLPFLALPLCRLFGRIGPWVMLAVMLLLGPIITGIFPNTMSGNYWMIGLFALGSMAAIFTVRGGKVHHRWFGWAAVAAFIVAAIWMIGFTPHGRNPQIVSDTLAGGAVALGLVSMGRAALAGEMNLGRRVFEARPLVKIGLWSYSIYLIHSPLLGLANVLLLPLDLPTWLNWLILIGVALPIALAAAYGFFLLVERRFMTSHQRRELAQPASNERVTSNSRP